MVDRKHFRNFPSPFMSKRKSNFDFLNAEPRFSSFAGVATAAESVLLIDAGSSIINCRRALECAVRWLYSVDKSLEKPWDDRLAVLLGTDEFHHLVGDALFKRAEFIRKLGNHAAHTHKVLTQEQAMLCLQNLHIFLQFIGQCYSSVCPKTAFNPDLLSERPRSAPSLPEQDPRLEELLRENADLREQLTAQRVAQQLSYESESPDICEYATRKIYIDLMLEDAGWEKEKTWREEVELYGMPNTSGLGYADYLLYNDAGRVLAVVEAKKTSAGIEAGRQQAKLYADIIEKKQGFRPVVFLTNGFDTHIIDNRYPERPVAAIYSKRDLEKLFHLQSLRRPLGHAPLDESIIDRYYQKGAVRAVCETLDAKNKRKALLVMATGSGKTRTIIALCKVLQEQDWVKNILFLADRTALVTQAKRAFTNLLPNLSLTNLCEDKANYNARCVFSTYMTMMNCIDSARDAEGKLFTCGHFDLVICDEAHRSVYNKYREIFDYFDAPLVGLTATPKDDIDKNTYEIFQLQDGTPTYGYDLAQGVADHYLVDYVPVEVSTKFLSAGIHYDDLTAGEKDNFEDTFTAEDGSMPESISPAALNAWVFNRDTIVKVLHTLMEQGHRIDYGNKLGKSIIFAKNHDHAERILDIFHEEYPHLPSDYAKVIDNHITYAQSAIDEFSDPEKMPQIAISVDMMDTGIDVPEVLNLVFFKKVMSKAKFWQMIGRGTRLCPGLLDGKDKENFYIFDFCGNFEFFRMQQGKPVAATSSLQASLFVLKAQIVYELQALAYQTEELQGFRQTLVAELAGKVNALNRRNFAVHQHLRYVEKFSKESAYQALTFEDTLTMKQELAPLIEPEQDEINAVRFDALLYGIELAYLSGDTRKLNAAKREIQHKASALSKVANIPVINARKDLLTDILLGNTLEKADINGFERIRTEMRELLKYLPREHRTYTVNYTDSILSIRTDDNKPVDTTLEPYRTKVEFYIRRHLHDSVIAKLHTNIPLTPKDVQELERILWNELGTKEDYEKEYQTKPLGEFVRELVGLDMNAAKAAFAQFLDTNLLDSRQIYFVNQIVEYIVQNGLMKDLSVLQDAPFTNYGSIVEIFERNITLWNSIRETIQKINANAAAA